MELNLGQRRNEKLKYMVEVHMLRRIYGVRMDRIRNEYVKTRKLRRKELMNIILDGLALHTIKEILGVVVWCGIS